MQTFYVQVEQKLCTEAILATLDSIQSRSCGARYHEQSLWTNLKDILDARFTLTNDQQLLENSIEIFCVLSVEEQTDLHNSGDNSIDCYNDLIDHLGAKCRVPLIGDNLYDSKGQETSKVVTQDLVEQLGPELYYRYRNCAQYDASHEAVTSLREMYRDNDDIQMDIRDALAVIKQCDDDEQQLVLSLRRLEDGSKQNSLEEQNVMLVGKRKSLSSTC